MILSERLFPLLKSGFPNRGLQQDESPSPCAMFPGIHPEFGDIQIYDDGDELTIVVGNFTHGHFSMYNFNDVQSENEKADLVVEQVVSFLSDLFADKVVLWGSHQGSGGWYYPEHVGNKQRNEPEYVWSGPRLIGGKKGIASEHLQ